jgi:hypothetical protein
MAKKTNIVRIDFDVWCTQQQKAGDDHKKFAQIRQQVKRRLQGDSSPLLKSDLLEIKQLGITLVRK